MNKRMKVNLMSITDEQLRDYERGFFYNNYEDKIPWEPFEGYSDEWLEEQIETNVLALKQLLRIKD